MSLDVSDLVDSLLSDQARVNAAVESPDVNDLVADFGIITGEKIGFQAETLTTTAMATGHKWGDAVGLTQWGFFKWAT